MFENWFEILGSGRAKINALLRHGFAILLRGIVSSSEKTFVRGGMSIGQRVAMIRSEKIVRNALLGEIIKRQKMPSPLAVTGFEMFRTTVAPDRNRMKGFVEETRRKKMSKNFKNKEEIVLVGVSTITNIVEILGEATALLQKLEDNNEILCIDTGLITVS